MSDAFLVSFFVTYLRFFVPIPISPQKEGSKASNYKYYVVDLGLRNILQKNNPISDLGHKLENVVYFELLRRGGEVFAGQTDNGEVDFVVMKPNGERAYYQVAALREGSH